MNEANLVVITQKGESNMNEKYLLSFILDSKSLKKLSKMMNSLEKPLNG